VVMEATRAKRMVRLSPIVQRAFRLGLGRVTR
jgi:hypothetical protein